MTATEQLDRTFSPLAVGSTGMAVLDLYGVPYTVHARAARDGLQEIRGVDGTRVLLWPSRSDKGAALCSLEGMPLLASVVSDDEADRLLANTRFDWQPISQVLGPDGMPVSSVRLSPDGSLFIPFDPNLADMVLRTEAYVEGTSGALAARLRDAARTSYYRLRPFLPRPVQLTLRRGFTRVQDRAAFPGWPVEMALHDLHEWLLGLIQMIVGRPLPQISWWPDHFEWAVVLTHDVERSGGYDRVQEVAELERDVGLRSAWYFVPERDYVVELHVVEDLWDDGFEVGVHGLRHDGRDLTPRAFESRIQRMREHAERWRATGFRAPGSQRSWSLIGRLGFDYDSSYSDVARYEPQPGGSCSWLPFFVGDVVELPMTLPMDHTVFDLLGHRDAGIWHEKSEVLRSRGGMALLLTHPDYLTSRDRLEAYVEFLRWVAADATAWCALPREVSGWWRDRTSSRIEWDGSEWVVAGLSAPRARVHVRDRKPPLRLPQSRFDRLGTVVLTTIPALGEELLGVAALPLL
jgi:hypothetical protein